MRLVMGVRFWSILFFLFLVGAVSGQEEQVAFIPGVFELNEAKRAKANVLNDLSEGFIKARLFKNMDGYILRIDYQNGEGSKVSDIPYSFENLAALRVALKEALGTEPIEEVEKGLETVVDKKTPSGRGYLIASTSLHAIPQSIILSNLIPRRRAVFNDPFGGTFTYTEKSTVALATPYILTAGAITSSILLTRNKDIPLPAANMHFWGSLLGYGHGFLLTSLFREPYDWNIDNYALENILISGTSIAEGWAGYMIAKNYNFSYARTKAINSGNFWGGAMGIFTYGIFSGDEFSSSQAIGFSGLIGSAVGLFGSNMLFTKYPRSSGDLTSINVAGLAGAAWGFSLAETFGELDLTRLPFVAVVGSTVGGLAISSVLTKNTNFTNLEGGLIAVSSIAGGALGLGFATLIDTEYNGYFYAAALGLTAGWVASYAIFSKTDTRLKSLGFGGKLRWNINPASLGLVMSSPDRQANILRQNIRMDMLGLNYVF